MSIVPIRLETIASMALNANLIPDISQKTKLSWMLLCSLSRLAPNDATHSRVELQTNCCVSWDKHNKLDTTNLNVYSYSATNPGERL